MDVYLVEFACDPKDEIKVYLLDDKMMDDWCQSCPPQDYKHFKTIWHGELEGVLTALNDIREIATHDP
jgi:hypothetical protein